MNADTEKYADLCIIFENYITSKDLTKALSLAKQDNISVFQIVLSYNMISIARFLQALSRYFEVDFYQGRNFRAVDKLDKELEAIIQDQHSVKARLIKASHSRRKTVQLVCPARLTLSQLKKQIAYCKTTCIPCLLTDRESFRAAIENQYSKTLSTHAIYGLSNQFQNASACSLFLSTTSRKIAILGVITILALVVSAFLHYFPETHLLSLIGLALSPIFLALISLRLWAVLTIIRQSFEKRDRTADPEYIGQNIGSYPVYTILVPLYKEARILPSLTKALQELDYPKEKLDIKLIMEEDDQATIDKANSLDLPYYFECLVVPHSLPKTKPKALNYALTFAYGDYVVIYDAEDRPDKDQLKKALAYFSQGASNLVCLQASLGIYNAKTNWLTKQFTVEYSTLFYGLLPTLSQLKLPFLLGGTSNHFKINALKHVGGWDAFNVTEDADLGIRLYRKGFSCATFPSTTYEESCTSFPAWFGQRTRWLKGWLQTWCVHMQNPKKLFQDLGTKNFLCVQVILGGQILASFSYPIFWGSLLYFTFVAPPQSLLLTEAWERLFLISLSLILVSYFITGLLGLLALKNRHNASVSCAVIWIPFYWICISVAAYRALFQFFTKPFHWEKTDHGHSLPVPIANSINKERKLLEVDRIVR